jgi:membrane protein YdbS with pleckstrin-like domain
MAETIIRPTKKFVTAGYVVVLLVIILLAFAAVSLGWPPLIAWLSPLLLIWPLKSDMQNRMSRLTILEDKLRFDVGFLSKTTRTILIPRIQDITVQQSVTQRIFGVGNLSIETAGESSRLTIEGIDRPQEVADMINELSRKTT